MLLIKKSSRQENWRNSQLQELAKVMKSQATYEEWKETVAFQKVLLPPIIIKYTMGRDVVLQKKAWKFF